MNTRGGNMRRSFAILSAIVLSASTFAQGTLIFNNRTPDGDARVSLPDGSGAGNLPGVVAQLFRVSNGAVLTPLTPTTTFRTSPAPTTYFLNEISPFEVDGVLPGQPVTVRIRVYEGTSFDNARASGLFHAESNDVLIPQLGGTLENGETIPAAPLNGLQWFSGPLTPTLLRFASFSIDGEDLRFGISVVMPQPNPYVLEASQNAVTWQPIVTNPPSDFSMRYDPAEAKFRFFRLRTIPQTMWGTLNFDNRTPGGDVRIQGPDGTGAGNLPDIVAQLYLVEAGGTLTALTPTTTFRTGSEVTKYFINPIDPFAVQGMLPGQAATVRVYQGTSFQHAQVSGLYALESNDVHIPQLGGTLGDGTVIPTPGLIGLNFWFPL